jgi:hypothetical protein
MAQIQYRGNLSAKVFPFLSSQFGRSVVVGSSDQAGAFINNTGDSSGGDNNIPQAYYMHNVMPTAQGYKSVAFSEIIKPVGVSFNRVIPIRDPDMTRGLIGITTSGGVYIYRAGDTTWTDVSAQLGGWTGGDISVAYAAGYTYLCLSKFNVFKLYVAGKTLLPVALSGLVASGIVSITSAANYLVVTDGVQVYWSSTVTPEDFVPSLITGAGSGKPEGAEGAIIALVPLSSGFAAYTSVNVVVASYSQNARFPFIFKRVDNSKGIAESLHIASGGEDGINYAWTSAGIQKITATGAVTYLPEVSDFLAGKELEVWNSITNEVDSQYLSEPMKVKLAFIGARFLVVSYGVTNFTHALVFDTSIKRWGKLKLDHVDCFDVSLNSDGQLTTSKSASAKKTFGIMTTRGSVVVCNFDNPAKSTDSVIVLGKYQLLRSRLMTMDGISLENIEATSNCEVLLATTYDGKDQAVLSTPALVSKSSQVRNYACRVTGVNHSVIIKGTFNLNTIMLDSHVNGRR